MKYCRFQRGQCLLAYNDDEDKDRQWDHKRNHALRIWRSKDLQWGKRDLLGKMRPKCGPNLELLRTHSRCFHQNSKSSLKSAYLQHYIFCDKSAVHYGLSFSPFWGNETFCVKCVLNADHFNSLVRMRTNSAIADLYGPTGQRQRQNALIPTGNSRVRNVKF